jgi:CDP-diglyceride synthetase
MTLLLACAVAAGGLLVGRAPLPRSTVAVLMGAAAGTCFALDAVFLKGVAASEHVGSAPRVFDLAGFVIASVLGNLVVQRAYQQAPLRHVLPAVTAADPVAASVVGVLILHEHLMPGLVPLLGLVGGLVAMVIGIVVATSAGVPAEPSVRDKATVVAD